MLYVFTFTLTLCLQIVNMAGKDDSFAAQLLSGLLSDVDMASAVLNHTFGILCRHIDNHGIDSLLDSKLLEQQLNVILSCLQTLSCKKDSQTLDNYDGSANSHAGVCAGVANICTNLLDFLCCPVLDRLAASRVSSDYNHRTAESVLSVLVLCFVSATREAQSKVLHRLINLLNCRELSSLHLPVVSSLSCLYECTDNAAFHQTATNDLLTVIEELCIVSEEPFAGQILVQLMPSILTHYGEHREVVIAHLWSIVERSYSTADADCISRCCFLICGLADVLFMPGNASEFLANFLSSSTLWHCVQEGLWHTEALSRKRAIFVLRRALDFSGMISNIAESAAVGDSADVLNSVYCLSRLSSVWHEVIILFETLEEKQVGFYWSVILQITVSEC